MDRFVQGVRQDFVVASFYMFPDLMLCVFAKGDVCYHFFMKGELVIYCVQRNDRFDHVCFLCFSFRLSRVFGVFILYMREFRVYIVVHKHVYRLEKRPPRGKLR